MSLEENRGSFNFRHFGPPLYDIHTGAEVPQAQYGGPYRETTHAPYALSPSIFRPPPARKATRKAAVNKNLKRNAPMNLGPNNTGRRRKPSRKVIEAAEAAAEIRAAKAEAAQARAARAEAARAIVAREEQQRGFQQQNAFAKMLRQSRLEGPQFSMGFRNSLPKLPKRRGGKRRTVRRRR